jgi:N-acetylmuramoyl-L-alanine amidase
MVEKMKILIVLFVLFPAWVWGNDIVIALTPTDSSVPAQSYHVRHIVIDPGCGGKDFGAIGYDKKLLEKDLNLKITKKVMDLLKQETGLEVLMTRRGDNDISPKERIEFANSHKADLFVSIRCIQSGSNEPDKDFLGTSISYDSPTTATDSTKVSSDEEVIGILHQKWLQTRSLNLAEMIIGRINIDLERSSRVTQQNPLDALTQLEMPEVEIGMANIADKEETKKIEDPDWQNKMANAIKDGILDYRNEVEGISAKPDEQSWNPSKEDIARLEKGLNQYVLSEITIKGLAELLPQYDHSYTGVYINGKKVINIMMNYLQITSNLTPVITPSVRLANKKIVGEIEACDPNVGYPCFSLDFDIQTGKFSHFQEENFFDSSAGEIYTHSVTTGGNPAFDLK